MKSRLIVVAVMVSFVLGIGVGALAGKGKITPAIWADAEPEAAADALLDAARELAGGGSWENIAVGRVYYLSGRTDEGQAIFDRYLGKKGEPSDLIRIARIYIETDDWDKARPLLEEVQTRAAKDADWLAEIGALYNLNGDRETAEEYFERSFAKEPAALWNTLRAAGSYIGVQPD